MIIYADLLFIIDASMDILTLFLCAKCTHRKVSLVRLLLGSAVGALGSVFLLFAPENPIVHIISGGVISCLMVLTAFGTMDNILSFIRQCVLVWGCGALAGGILSVFLSLGTPVYTESAENRGYPTAFLATVAVCMTMVRLFTRRKSIGTTAITVRRGNNSEKITALVDSGNLLTDPLSGRPAILVSETALHRLYPVIDSIHMDENLKIRLIPSQSVAGEKLLYGIIPDEVTVGGIRKDVVLVVEDVAADHYGGQGALCPMCILN